MEFEKEKFLEKMKGLEDLAKKKKNVLEYEEINDYFKDMPLDAEQMDKVFDYLDAKSIDVLRISDNGSDSDDDILLLSDDDDEGKEDDVDMEKIDLSVPKVSALKTRCVCT